MNGRFILGGAAAFLLAGCTTSTQRVTGRVRTSVSPQEVRVYTQSPASFEEVAVLSASRRALLGGGERAIAKVIGTMKLQAAKLGANGLLLEDFSDSQTLTVGTGLGSQTYTHNASISLGVGGYVGLVSKTGKARAIYVSGAVPAQPPAPPAATSTH